MDSLYYISTCAHGRIQKRLDRIFMSHTHKHTFRAHENAYKLINRPSFHRVFELCSVSACSRFFYCMYFFAFQHIGRSGVFHNGSSGHLRRRYRRHFAAIRRRHIAASTRRHIDAARFNCAAAAAQSADHHSANACEVSAECSCVCFECFFLGAPFIDHHYR